MKYLLSALSVLFLSSTTFAMDVLRIGTEGAYPPWNSTSSAGELEGFEVDLGNALCKEIKRECQFVAQDWDGIIPALTNGKYDVIMAAMTVTEERKQAISFSEPYADEVANFAAIDGEFSDSIASEPALRSALKGKVIGVQVSTIFYDYLDRVLGDAVEIRTYKTQEELNLDLLSGRLDAALSDTSSWQEVMEENEEIVLVGPRLTGQVNKIFGDGIAAGMRKNDAALLKQVNDGFAALRAKGVIKALSIKHFGYDASL